MDKKSLEHHGVLGMKWGVRRSPEQLGYKKTSSGEKKKVSVKAKRNAELLQKRRKAALNAQMKRERSEARKKEKEIRKAAKKETKIKKAENRAEKVTVKLPRTKKQPRLINFGRVCVLYICVYFFGTGILQIF